MAIDYTKLFTTLGQLVQWNAVLDTAETAVLTEGAAAYDTLDNAGAAAKTTIAGLYAGQSGGMQGHKSAIAGLLQPVLNTYVAVPNLLPVNDLNVLLKYLYDDMLAQAESVQANGVTLGTITAGGSNTGAATVHLFAQRGDSPVNSASDPAVVEYILSQNWTLKCVADKYVQASSGAERFTLSGQTVTPIWSVAFGGQGVPATLTAAHGGGGSNVLTTGGFEAFSAGIPSGWSLVAGSAVTTHVVQETTTFYRGASALKLIATDATYRGVYAALSGLARQNTSYLVSCRIRGATGVAAGVHAKVQITGTGYTAGTTETIDYASISDASFVQKSFFWNCPQNLPTDLALKLTVGGAAGAVYIDEVVFVPLTMVRGLGVAVVATDDDSLIDDTYTFAVTNDYAGKFQTWFARCGFALPSSGSPTIDEALAT